MIPQLTFLTIQSLGLPKKATKCSVHLSKDMQQFVRTLAGFSKDYYTHSEYYPKFGEDQCKHHHLQTGYSSA
eukprot:10696973-Ditylum_brightwellii.AAC.1